MDQKKEQLKEIDKKYSNINIDWSMVSKHVIVFLEELDSEINDLERYWEYYYEEFMDITYSNWRSDKKFVYQLEEEELNNLTQEQKYYYEKSIEVAERGHILNEVYDLYLNKLNEETKPQKEVKDLE